MIRHLRALVAGAAVTTALAAGVPFGTGSAAADVLDVTCVGTQTVTYNPGLTLQPKLQSIHFNNIFAPCVSATVPELTSGVSIGTAQRVASCLDLAEPDSSVLTINWNISQSSVFAYNRTVTTVGGTTVVTLTGVITFGLFAGDTAIIVTTGPAINLLDCLSPPGVTNRAGVVALTITST
ncbi:MAG TPA: hypothetical protein VLJ59_03285 [Mycobacteriales bacterium]|nr:hypothetical protein [Mycobacteriales bacterium]